jgi:hypothetical protein
MVPVTDSATVEFYLTSNNGSHAIAMTKYDNGTKLWTSILAERYFEPWVRGGFIRAYEKCGKCGTLPIFLSDVKEMRKEMRDTSHISERCQGAA